MRRKTLVGLYVVAASLTVLTVAHFCVPRVLTTPGPKIVLDLNDIPFTESSLGGYTHFAEAQIPGALLHKSKISPVVRKAVADALRDSNPSGEDTLVHELDSPEGWYDGSDDSYGPATVEDLPTEGSSYVPGPSAGGLVFGGGSSPPFIVVAPPPITPPHSPPLSPPHSSPVPEPSSWVLMLLGVLLVSGSLRSRKSVIFVEHSRREIDDHVKHTQS